MAKMISPDAIVGKKCVLEYPVRVFAFSSIQTGAEIGRYTYINRYSFVHGSVRMGRFCSLARGVDLGAKSHRLDLMSTHPFIYNAKHFEEVSEYGSFPRRVTVKSDRTYVGHDVWFGAKAVIATGITIGTGAVIAANSFVREDVEPYAIVGGTPAKVLKYRFPPKIVERLLASEWWNLHPQEMKDITFEDENIENVLEQIEALRLNNDLSVSHGTQERQVGEGLLDMLISAMLDMDIPEDVADLVVKTSASANLSFDPDEPLDQQVFRNKLLALSELVNLSPTLGPQEIKKIQNLFRSMN